MNDDDDGISSNDWLRFAWQFLLGAAFVAIVVTITGNISDADHGPFDTPHTWSEFLRSPYAIAALFFLLLAAALFSALIGVLLALYRRKATPAGKSTHSVRYQWLVPLCFALVMTAFLFPRMLHEVKGRASAVESSRLASLAERWERALESEQKHEHPSPTSAELDREYFDALGRYRGSGRVLTEPEVKLLESHGLK